MREREREKKVVRKKKNVVVKRCEIEKMSLECEIEEFVSFLWTSDTDHLIKYSPVRNIDSPSRCRVG